MEKITDISNVAVVIINLIIVLCTMITTVAKTKATIKKTIDDTLDSKLNEKLKGLYDDNRNQYRYQICDFAGDLHNKVVKTRDEFQAIFAIIDRYKVLVERLNVKNHFVDNEIAYINEQYRLLV